MASEYNLNGALLKLSISTEEAWANTTVIIPDGMICYATDTGEARVGTGMDLYKDLSTVFDAIPVALRELIDSGKLVYAADSSIPTHFFPKDVFNIHVVVADIAARDNLAFDTIENSQMVFVVDASADPTVSAGMAFYVAKFSNESTYTWVKTGEQESIDLDLSQYLKVVDTTIDDIADSTVYKRLGQEELDTVHSALQETDGYDFNLSDYLFWYDSGFDDESLISYIRGDTEGPIVDECGNAITVVGVTKATHANLPDGKTGLYFSQDSSRITYDHPAFLNFSTNDFTIYTSFVRPTVNRSNATLFRVSTNISFRQFTITGFSSIITLNSSDTTADRFDLRFNNPNALGTYGTYRIVRHGTTMYLFINDILLQSITIANTMAIPPQTTIPDLANMSGIGANPYNSNNSYLQNMYMSEFKIYKGKAMFPSGYVPE